MLSGKPVTMNRVSESRPVSWGAAGEEWTVSPFQDGGVPTIAIKEKATGKTTIVYKYGNESENSKEELFLLLTRYGNTCSRFWNITNRQLSSHFYELSTRPNPHIEDRSQSNIVLFMALYIVPRR